MILIASLIRSEGEPGQQNLFQTLMAYLTNQGVNTKLLTLYSAQLWQAYPTFALRMLIDPLSGKHIPPF